MARRGRKRSWGARERNGQHQRAPKEKLLEERLRLARSQPHRRELRSNDRDDERAESVLGRLNLRGSVTAGELRAGEAFAAIVGRYRSVIEGPRPMRSLMPETTPERAASPDELAAERFDCPSQYADAIEHSFKIGGRTITTREWPCQAAGAVCVCAERRTRYTRVYEAIAQAGRRALMVVIAVAVRGEDLAPSDLVYLKRGLAAGARHLGLTDVDR